MIYTVYASTGTHHGTRQINAQTPEAALETALSIFNDQNSYLSWGLTPHDVGAVEDIEVWDADGKAVVFWQQPSVRLAMAAPALLRAARKVVARWQGGDLAAAVRDLALAIGEVEPWFSSLVDFTSLVVLPELVWPARRDVLFVDCEPDDATILSVCGVRPDGQRQRLESFGWPMEAHHYADLLRDLYPHLKEA